MPRGGYRPGSGRKPGSKDKKPRKRPDLPEKEQIRKMLALGEKAKLRMYQEFLMRVANKDKDGKPLNLPALTTAEKRLMAQLGDEIAASLTEKPQEPPTGEDLEAADYLRKVWNDPHMDPDLRVKAAEIVLRAAGGKKGKKDEKQDRAKTAGAGRFAAGAPPLKLVGKK